MYLNRKEKALIITIGANLLLIALKFILASISGSLALKGLELTVTYHDPCDLGRHCEIYEEPRETIRKIAPNFVEMPHHHVDALCCG